MQRLLEEREKAAKMLEDKGEEAEKYAPKGHLRALIITPTRELALQVLIVARKNFSIHIAMSGEGLATIGSKQILLMFAWNMDGFQQCLLHSLHIVYQSPVVVCWVITKHNA